MGSLGEVMGTEFASTPPDPIVIELNRLENHLKEKEKELAAAHCEIKALKVAELLKDKAVMELSNELRKLESKLRNAERRLEDKNLEIKKLNGEKKEALAAQFSAEAALRRVHAMQKDEESLPVEAIIAPYESEIRMYRSEIANLQEDKKALERLTKSKEAALIGAERISHSAQERAQMVETLQNQNLDLRRQIEICQEENRLLEKTNRQKVVEVEKLSQTIRELEESVLAGGAVANAVRDYQRQVFELNEEKKTLERELARVKVSANRVATMVASEWKDDNDKLMPVKQYLEERKCLQGEIRRLRDKLAISERAAKAEAHLKDKIKLRMKTIEEGLKEGLGSSVKLAENSEKIFSLSPRERSTSQPQDSLTANKTSASEGVDSTRKMIRTNSLKTKFVMRSKFFDVSGKENAEKKANCNGSADVSEEVKYEEFRDAESQHDGGLKDEHEDIVPGFLYDRLQKEVISLRKLHEDKDALLNSRDDEIKLLQRKVDALSKAMEVESKKMRREAATKEKKVLLMSEDTKQKIKIANISKRSVKNQEATTNSRI